MKTTSKNKGNGIDADVSGNRLPFKSQSINNFCGIDISQPTPSESLSVALFSLGNMRYVMTVFERPFYKDLKTEKKNIEILLST